MDTEDRQVFCDVGHTLVAGDMIVSCQSVQGFLQSKVAPRMIYEVWILFCVYVWILSVCVYENEIVAESVWF